MRCAAGKATAFLAYHLYEENDQLNVELEDSENTDELITEFCMTQDAELNTT